jgi:hypothetical protein
MEMSLSSHRHADVVMSAEAPETWRELREAIENVSDEQLIEEFEGRNRQAKSLSEAINALLKRSLVGKGWLAEAPIFQDAEYQDKRWRLDFAKEKISVEIAFNHGEAIAWNLLKPVLASEYNHIKKAIQTRFGVVICATEELKAAGGFDGAVGTYEKFIRYLIPLQNPLTVPIMLVGLRAPRTFRVAHQLNGRRKIGTIQRL